ncbi:hypothetical protein RNI15_34090, partial [Pseudomonas aeruginosa]|nr:hypothetical protein [Pseudomonas aeruginosa]
MEHLAVLISAKAIKSQGVFLDHQVGENRSWFPAAQSAQRFWGGQELVSHACTIDDPMVESNMDYLSTQ